MIENYMNWNWKGILFEEFGNGFKVTIFGKVSSKSEKVSSVLEEVGSTFDNYLPFLKEVKITDVFINNIEIVFNNCGVGVPFGQSNVMEWLNCSKSKVTNIMNVLRSAGIIEKVTCLGVGKYKFR
ncbi:MAG: hypothetical protein SPJ45_00985 [Anaerovoracaceae bacterium]|nr:hypothetical protein [Anaerovoracaceae bacterium]